MSVNLPGFDIDYGANVVKQVVSFPLRLKQVPAALRNGALFMSLVVNGVAQPQPLPVTVDKATGQATVQVTVNEGDTVQTTLGGAAVANAPIQWDATTAQTIKVPMVSGAPQQPGTPQAQPSAPQVVTPQPGVPTAAPNAVPNAPFAFTPANFPQPVNDVSKEIRGPILALLDSVRNPEKAGGIGGILEMAENRLRAHAELNGIPAKNRDFTAYFTEEIYNALIADKTAPNAVKARLTKNGPPKSLDELKKMLVEGGMFFRADVLSVLKGDAKAQKLFDIKRTSNLDPKKPFSNPEHNVIFDRLCTSADFGALAQDLPKIIGSIAKLPERDSDEIKAQARLHKKIMDRLSPEERAGLKKWLPRGVNMAVQGASYAAMFGLGGWLGWGVGLGTLVGKPILGSLAGVHQEDIALAIKERKILPIMKLFWKNNFVARRFSETAELGADAKEAGIRLAKRAIIAAPLFTDTKGSLEETTHASEAAQLIQAACQKAAV